ncbi:hypothetical protein [Poritiphilus flavus]|uniref:Uncharacterized protein n=1 Tax=Poritiphilus flavus TaxID=2697053 RepID=A0A6L9EGG3_9FLAO|nr:hypothetical protein [Poritiphilus flavus]NAS13732.1 hypothetical protein [Poritiphilus flavus]
MVLDELKKDLTAADADLRSYFENSEEYLKLRVFKVLMRAITSGAKVLLVGSVALLTLFLLSLATSFGIGQLLNNTFYGFLITGGFFILVTAVCYYFRNRVNGPLLRRFSSYYFD